MTSYFHNGAKIFFLNFVNFGAFYRPWISSLHKNRNLFHSYYLPEYQNRIKRFLSILLHFVMTPLVNYGNFFLAW